VSADKNSVRIGAVAGRASGAGHLLAGGSANRGAAPSWATSRGLAAGSYRILVLLLDCPYPAWPPLAVMSGFDRPTLTVGQSAAE
jgi:hypothetical protein